MPFARGFTVPEGPMIPSLIRTYVPLAVAYLVGWLASLGIDVGSEAQAALTAAIGTVVAGVYYAAVRWAEQRWPALSVLLGSAKQPAVYADPKAPGSLKVDGPLTIPSAPAVTVTQTTAPAIVDPARADPSADKS